MYEGTTLDRYLLDYKTTMGSTSYLTRPRPTLKNYGDKENLHSKSKKSKIRKNIPKMMDYGIKKRLPDYTELAYKEAVNRLRFFLSESYAPSSRSSKVGAPSLKNLDESGDEAYDVIPKAKYPISFYGGGLRPYNPIFLPPSNLTKRYPFYPRDNYRSNLNADNVLPINVTTQDGVRTSSVDPSSASKLQTTDPELMSFIQKQEEYIEQLERESSYCRDELNNLLGKVKEVISENESLHEKQKNQILSSVMDHRSGMSESDENDGDSTGLDSDAKYTTVKKKSSFKPSSRLQGPNIVFESKISELEAQLTQSNINLKKMQDENSEIRKKVNDGTVDSPYVDSYKRQIENLQRDKSALEVQVDRLKASLDDRKDCDTDLVTKIKRSADLAYQANYDKTQLEMEIRRLKEELERQQSRVRELLGEQTRRVMEERSAIERRYCSQVEQLTSDLTTHWDSATKLQLELERQKREESDLKRELLQKNSQIEDLKLELKNKIASLQADVAQSHADRAAVEEELANTRLVLERHQRQAKHDANRLNSEVQSVRQRLDRADADLVHSRRENLRLMEQLSNMEKEMNLKSLRPASPKEKEPPREKELSNMIMNMENKHAQTVSELEAMVCSQNSLMEKLTAECHLLTSKLDDASQKHKQEMASLQNKLEQLSVRVHQGSVNTDSNNVNTAKPTNNTPSEYFTNANEHPNQIEPGGRTVSPESSRVEPGITDNGKPTVNNTVKEQERFDKQFKQSEEPSNGGNLNPSQVYDDSNKHNLDDREQHNNNSTTNEQRTFDEEQTPDYTAEQYGTESNQDYVDPNSQQYTDPNEQYADPNQQYADPNQQYADPNEYQEQQYDPNQQYDANQEYAEQYAPDQQYAADPNQQYDANYDDSNQQYAEQQ